ncbi:hypothetical protein M3P21_19080 [Ruegeria sp. 2012CJ41-6]|uniref:G8 domain-containing protein n=1 Tax=Ruegeria spongiae TaxID=2942209 RepID=A0ABT0Q6Y6_9RHOB|nr:G8 domain-containing protein [Ruegeria spongiae]MCL6285636.1 hypothetical protein [Ruegeria spongiae]
MDTHMDMGGHAGHAEHAAQVNALFAPADATHVAVKDGNWSDASTWSNGKVPGDGAMVHIPEGKDVTYDVYSAKELDMVRVDGTLSWSQNKDTSMHVDTILTSHGSHLEIGTMDNPMPADVSAEITFVDGPIDLKEDPGQISRGLVAFGEVEIHGADKASYLTMNGGAQAGSKTITVEGDTDNWEVGDQILLVGTGDGSRDETRAIVSVNGNKITFDKALNYDHEPPAGFDFDTYVGNLSRNVVLQSENPDGIRGHFMMHNGMTDAGQDYANMVLNAEFRDMGRTDHSRTVGTEPGDSNPQGRYSIHMHQIGTEPDSAVSLIEGNAVAGNPGWGIVQHSSQAMINENIVYDVTGAGIVSEWGDETGEWNGNLVSSVTGPTVSKQVGSEGAAYENQSRVIVQQDNIAANSLIGWNYSGRESFPEDELHSGAPKDGMHRKQFEREQLPYDPSPFDMAIDHEEPAIVDFDNNTAIGTGTAFRVFHRQMAEDTDTMSVIDNFTVWGGEDAVNLDNYSSNYLFKDSTWQGDGIGFRVERKTSSAVFNNVDMHDFSIGYKSLGLNHEMVLIDTDFHNVRTEFDLADLLIGVHSDSLRKELISYFKSKHGINYENPMPKIVDSDTLTPVNAVTFKADGDADLTITPKDRGLNITGTITDSVGVRNFNEYVIAKTPKGTGTSQDFEGIRLTLFAEAHDEPFVQKEITVDQFLELHGTYQKGDGSWVSPVVNWITDRLTGDQHPVIIEIKLDGFDPATMKAHELSAYPDPGINNPDFDYNLAGGGSGHGGHTGGGDGGHTGGGDGGHTGGGDDGHTGGGDDGHTGGGDDGHTGGGDDGQTGGGDDGHTGGGDGGHTGGGDDGHTGGGDDGHTGGGDDGHTGGGDGGHTGDDSTGVKLVGGNEADVFTGTMNNDVLEGARGNDTLTGRAGHDEITGGLGKDKIYGGNGHDTLDGMSAPDEIRGGLGHDLVYGGGGNDLIGGGMGKDTLFGGYNHDVIFGSGGNDLIDGGAGNDRMSLGRGDDVLIFSTGQDTVRDFDAQGDDLLNLSLAEGITNFADLKANHLSNVGGKAVITDDAGNSLTFVGVDVGSLTSDDFIF